MVSVVKSEWHQVEKRYGIEIDTDILSEIYPDKEEDEIEVILEGLGDGTYDIEDILNDAWENNVDLDWDYLNEDDWWTDRKGGYDVTYKVEDWEVHQEYVSPITHKCTKCKWTGSQYDAQWSWEDKDGNELDEAIKICPMCDSNLDLTDVGVEEATKDAKNKAQWSKLAEDDEEELVDETELEEALEELKAEFEILSAEDKTTAQWPSPNSDFVETAKWPFDNPVEDDSDSLKESYPEDTYTIRVWGRTREIGVHKIKKQQYEHWSSEEHEDDLSDALNENYDYDENKTPKAAQFDLPYYEYQGKHSFWGFDQDDTHMTIENSEGETIYDGDIESFFSDAHGEEDSRYDCAEELEELYPEHLGKGYWLMWTQGGKGSCIQTSIEGVFEPKKLKVFNWDIQGTSVVTRLVYDGDELDDEGMDSEHDNWRGQWSQFDVYHNAK
jgi:hypothetical protein